MGRPTPLKASVPAGSGWGLVPPSRAQGLVALMVGAGAVHPGHRPWHSRATGRAGGRCPHLAAPRCHLSLGHLSLGHLSLGHLSLGHPSLGHPSRAPRRGHLALGRLDWGCLGSGCPNRDCPNRDRPNRDRPNRDRPNRDRPNRDRPNRDRPNRDRPNRGRLSCGRPALDAGAARTWASRMRRTAGCPWQASRVSTATWPGRAMLGGRAARCPPDHPQRYQDRAIPPGRRPARALRGVPDGPPSRRLELPIRPRILRHRPASFPATRADRSQARQAARASRDQARRPDRPWPGRSHQWPPQTPLAAAWARAGPAMRKRPRRGTATPLIPRRPARSRRKRPVSPLHSACRACTGVYGAAGCVAARRAGG